MADVTWVKVSTSTFTDSRKIKNIELMPNGDTIIIIWFKLILLAGRINDGGAIYVTPSIPYTDKGLAEELRRPVPTVKKALEIFEEYEMIEREGGVIYLVSWDKYQNVEGLDKVREQNRIRKQRQREKSRDGHVTGHEGVTLCHATEEEEGDLESHSIALSRATKEDFESEVVDNPSEEPNRYIQRVYVKGNLGNGRVMLSPQQIDILLSELSLDELEKYCRIIDECEKKGMHYKKKTHFSAIMEMAKKDRKANS